jgi:hypothetical protein
MLYRHTGNFSSTDVTFSAEEVHDRAQLFVDNREVGVAYRPKCPTKMQVPAGSSADLLVENMGRVNYGEGIYDHKGFLGQPPIPGNWSAWCLPLKPKQVQWLDFRPRKAVEGPIFQKGTLHVSHEPSDTWLDMRGFTKGYVWVNGHNLGRFWETAGPQHTLYLPAPFLVKGHNEVIVLDLHLGAKAPTSVLSVSKPRYYSESVSMPQRLAYV